ncbi:APC family permease [Sphingomonas lutea]|nr:amino acid permease [Sphingomonas lutea]
MTTAFVVGGMIGAGIFMLPASLAPYGRNAPIAWVVSGLGAVALAFALSSLARRSGGGHGMQAHVEAALGPTFGFLAGFSFWVSVWVSNAAVGITGASALARIVPALSGETSILLVAAGFILFLAIVNALGAVVSGRFAVATTLIKLTPLVGVLVLAGAFTAEGQPMAPLAVMPVTFDNIAGACAIALFALLGFETALAPVDKIRNPQRTIPLAMIGGTAFVATLYLLTTSAIAGLVPAEQLVESKAPFADALVLGLGGLGVAIAVLGMAVSAFGYINGGILISGELGLAMALRGDLPASMTRTRGAGTPVVAQLVASGLALLLIAANASKGTVGLFTFSVLLTTSASLWMYVLCAIAAWRMTSSIGSKAVIFAGIAFVALAFYGSGWEANAWSIVLLLAGLAVRWIIRSRGGSSPEVAETRA